MRIFGRLFFVLSLVSVADPCSSRAQQIPSANPPSKPQVVDPASLTARYNTMVLGLITQHQVTPADVFITQVAKVRIAFWMDESGAVTRTQVDSTSGYPSVDAAALKAVIDASPLPPLPIGSSHGFIAQLVFPQTDRAQIDRGRVETPDAEALDKALSVRPGRDVPSQGNNFIQIYIERRGGCPTPLDAKILFIGVRKDAPFGKRAEDWSDEDRHFLNTIADQCVSTASRARPGADLIQAEQKALQTVDQAIKEARQRVETRNEQLVAAQRSAFREVDGFSGHVMSSDEVNRAQQLKSEFPGLAAQIDGLLANQIRLKEEDAGRVKKEQERVEAAKRAQKDRLQASLPSTCSALTDASRLGLPLLQFDYQRMLTLQTAGDNSMTISYCAMVAGVIPKTEEYRVSLLDCYHKIAAHPEANADQKRIGDEALEQAAGLNTMKTALLPVIDKCNALNE